MTYSLKPVARRSSGRIVAILLAVSVALTVGATSARADFGVDPTSFHVSLSTSQAGAAPDLTTAFSMNRKGDGNIDGNLKELTVDLPAGLIGDPGATPRCKTSQFMSLTSCPLSTQVGTIEVVFNVDGMTQSFGASAVYNMVPPRGETAELAAVLFAPTLSLIIRVRSEGDYGLSTTTSNVSDYIGIDSTTLKLWGVPADSMHDGERGSCLQTFWDPTDMCPSPAPRRAYLRNAASCGPQKPAEIATSSWQDPQVTVRTSTAMPDITGCENLPPVEPKASIQPGEHSAGAPAGYDIDLDIPQVTNPNANATPPLKRVAIQFPEGTAISPGSADGLGACADELLHQHDRSQVACPDTSKIGTVSITTPYLDEPLEGAIFLRQPQPNDQFRLFLVAEGSGVSVRVKGSAVPDPTTGRLTATFDDLPPVAFSHLHVHMKGGSRAVLVNPGACGTATSTTTVTPYGGGADAASASSFDVGGSCAAKGFAAELGAGTTNPVAGADSPFVLQIRRGDDQQDLKAISVDLPAGLIGKVAGLPLCSTSAAIAGTCDESSRVGSVSVAVGTGSNPISLQGRAYLTEGYGGPFGLSFVVPAKIGPFDFGNVVVRAKVKVDPISAALRIESDDLPRIIAGIPLHYRAVTVNLDRPGFMFNPTNCNPMQITGQVTSAQGMAVDVQDRFQVADCTSLDLKPKLALSLSGKGQTTDNKHPGLLASLTMPSGQANLKKVAVTLPLSLALDPDNSQSDALCEFEAGRKTIPECPASSIVGRATARTPLLSEPLSGPVYFVKNVRTDAKTGRQIRTLPTLAIPLQGGGITLVLRASSAVVDDHLVTTFDKIPDVPVSDFKLNVNGGRKGILVVSGANICKATQTAEQAADGHNGKTADTQITISTPCALAVVASSHTPSTLKLTVGGIGAGKVSVSGKGIAKTSRTISSAATATLQPKLSKAARSSLAHGHNVKTRVTVSFTPKGAKKAKTAHKTLTIHGAKK